MLQRDSHAVVVDPGDALPVLAMLQERQLALDAILITHHHHDHIDGVAALLASYPAVVHAPRHEAFPFPHQAVQEGDVVQLPGLKTQFQVMDTPGHTLGHVVYYGANRLFCGDTLFGCGCGRLFEGTCQQLHHSLQRLAALPAATEVYCAHEYTLHNIRFARMIDPDNPALADREAETVQRAQQRCPSLPSTIALELATNPFLRCDDTVIQRSTGSLDPESAFCSLRLRRNSF